MFGYIQTFVTNNNITRTITTNKESKQITNSLPHDCIPIKKNNNNEFSVYLSHRMPKYETPTPKSFKQYTQQQPQ